PSRIRCRCAGAFSPSVATWPYNGSTPRCSSRTSRRASSTTSSCRRGSLEAFSLAERERVAGDPRREAEGEDVLADPRQIDEPVEALAGDLGNASVDVGTGEPVGDRLAVERDVHGAAPAR